MMTGNNTLPSYKGYAALVEYSVEDGCLIGRVIGIEDIIVFDGESVSEIEKAFHEAIDGYITNLRSIGREPEQPAEKLSVSVESSLLAAAQSRADHCGMSVNDFVQLALEKAVYQHI